MVRLKINDDVADILLPLCRELGVRHNTAVSCLVKHTGFKDFLLSAIRGQQDDRDNHTTV